MIYSSSYVWAEYKFDNEYRFAIQQFIFLIIGIIGMFILSKINTKIYYRYANIILFVCLLFLALVLIPGLGVIRNGSRSWFGIGSFGVQPSEFAKLGLLIYTSKYLANNKVHEKGEIKSILPLLFIILLNFGLIMLEPDFGTGIVLVIVNVLLIFVSGVKLKFFVTLFITGLLGIVGLIIAAPYRVARILSFLNPWSNPLGSGFQIIQSLYAIGPGGLLIK